MTARTDPAPLGDSRDNATRDPQRQRAQAIADLWQKLNAGQITQAEFDAMMSVHG